MSIKPHPYFLRNDNTGAKYCYFTSKEEDVPLRTTEDSGVNKLAT